MGGMVGRWIVRGLTVTLLAMCVAAWVGSYWWSAGVEYKPGLCYGVFATGGRIEVVRREPFFEDPGWHLSGFRTNPRHIPDLERDATRRWLVANVGGGETYWWVTVPMWAPAAVLALGAWVVWRKTRAKSGGQGFPVVPATMKEGELPP
jgi:hypothetical protein